VRAWVAEKLRTWRRVAGASCVVVCRFLACHSLRYTCWLVFPATWAVVDGWHGHWTTMAEDLLFVWVAYLLCLATADRDRILMVAQQNYDKAVRSTKRQVDWRIALIESLEYNGVEQVVIKCALIDARNAVEGTATGERSEE